MAFSRYTTRAQVIEKVNGNIAQISDFIRHRLHPPGCRSVIDQQHPETCPLFTTVSHPKHAARWRHESFHTMAFYLPGGPSWRTRRPRCRRATVGCDWVRTQAGGRTPLVGKSGTRTDPAWQSPCIGYFCGRYQHLACGAENILSFHSTNYTDMSKLPFEKEIIN